MPSQPALKSRLSAPRYGVIMAMMMNERPRIADIESVRALYKEVYAELYEPQRFVTETEDAGTEC